MAGAAYATKIPSLETGMAKPVAQIPQKTIKPVARAGGPFSLGAAPAPAAAPASQYAGLADQLRAQSPGMNWNIQGIDRAQELADWMGSRGVTNLGQPKLSWEDYTTAATPEGYGVTGMNEGGESYGFIAGTPETTTKRGYLDFGGVRLGNEGNIHTKNGQLGYIPDKGAKNASQAFASSTKGHGAVSYQYVQQPDGSVKIQPKWVSTSDMGAVRNIIKGGLALAGGFGLAGLGPLSGLGGAFGSAGAAGGAAGGAAAADIGALGLAEGVYGAGGALGAGLEAGTVGGLAGSTAGFGGLGSALPAGLGYGSAAAAGNGAFLGEGAASGIPAWDASVGLAGEGGAVGAGVGADAAAAGGEAGAGYTAPSYTSAAADSQLASSQLGITGDQMVAGNAAALNGGIPATVNLGSAGGTMGTAGGISGKIAAALADPVGAAKTAGGGLLSFVKANPQLALMGASGLGTLLGGKGPAAPTPPGSGAGAGGNSALATALENQIGGMGAAPDYSSVNPLKTTAGDLNTLNQKAIDAAYSQQTGKLDPQFQRDQQALEARLAEQGFVPGTPGYTQAMQIFGETKNQAYGSARDSSILQGYQIGQGDARNQLSDAELNNSASREALAQVLAKRNQPFNELASVKANQQIDYNNQLDQYNAQTQSSNSRNQALSQLALALGMYLG